MEVSEKPKTDCKVTLSQYHPVTNTLCVKVKPDCLIINKTDLLILTKQSLELSDYEWTYLTIRPAVQGVIHLHENVMYDLCPQKKVKNFVTLSSDICDGICMLIIKPSFVFSNQTKNLVSIHAEVSFEKEKKNNEDKGEEDFSLGLIRTVSNEIKALSFWSIRKDGDGRLFHHIYLSYDDQHWSSPVSIVQDLDPRH